MFQLSFQDIEKKYPGFIHMKLLQGIKLSFRLQQIVQESCLIVRGFRQKEGELPSALNGFLYSILKTTKAQRRAILTSLLKQFDDTSVSLSTPTGSLAKFVFHFPFLPAFLLSDLLLATHFCTDWLSQLGLGNQVGWTTDHL